MANKQANSHIRCRVQSCQYHLDDQNYCSLGAIQVEPCEGCVSGKPADESCCASYRHK